MGRPHPRAQLLSAELRLFLPALLLAGRLWVSGGWQPEKLYLAVSKDVYAGASVQTLSNDVTTKRNVVREMVVDIRAIKPIREPLKELQVAPRIEFVLA